MTLRLFGVLVADVIASRTRADIHSLLSKRLRILTRMHSARKLIRLPYAVTAGDEFQTITSVLDEIPSLILDLRRKLRPLLVRVGVGIGEVTERVRPPVNKMSGEAFQFAREALENIKNNRPYKFAVLTAFRSRNAVFDTTANLIYGLHDTLVQNVSEKQWETIDVYVTKGRVSLAAKKLSLNTSTAYRNLKRGYFWQLEETVATLKEIIGASFLELPTAVRKE